MNVNAGFLRNFYSNKTRWAGGALLDFYRDVNQINDTVSIISRFNLEKLWFGWAFLPKEKKCLPVLCSCKLFTGNNIQNAQL